MEFWLTLILSFLIGTVGALVIVWLRWIGTMPRFSSSVEIELLEEEYKSVSDYITKKIEADKDIQDPEVHHSDNLRDDIWRQRKTSFAYSALMYVVLGGATAVLFIGLETQSVLDPLVIGKLLAAGALWTSFYSFLDVKKAEEAVVAMREGADKLESSKLAEIIGGYEKRLTEVKNEANSKIGEIVGKYNELVDEYERITKGHGGKE